MLDDSAYDRAVMPNKGNTLANYFKPVPKVERPAVIDELQAEIEKALDEQATQRALDEQTERDLDESMAFWAH